MHTSTTLAGEEGKSAVSVLASIDAQGGRAKGVIVKKVASGKGGDFPASPVPLQVQERHDVGTNYAYLEPKGRVQGVEKAFLVHDGSLLLKETGGHPHLMVKGTRPWVNNEES